MRGLRLFCSITAGSALACTGRDSPVAPRRHPPAQRQPWPTWPGRRCRCCACRPASLGRTLNLQQQITVRYPSPQGEQTRDILALLEADAGHTRLAALAGGQVLARLDWDGSGLRVTRAPWAPAELVPERILSDLQLSPLARGGYSRGASAGLAPRRHAGHAPPAGR